MPKWCKPRVNPRADTRLPPSQWETSLQNNTVSHWLGANIKCTLKSYDLPCICNDVQEHWYKAPIEEGDSLLMWWWLTWMSRATQILPDIILRSHIGQTGQISSAFIPTSNGHPCMICTAKQTADPWLDKCAFYFRKLLKNTQFSFQKIHIPPPPPTPRKPPNIFYAYRALSYL